MRQFEYAAPANIDEALALLESDDRTDGGAGTTFRPLAGVQPLAGGTDLLTLVKADVAAPPLLVNIKGVDGLHAGIEETPEGLRFGALTTLAEIEHSPLVQARLPVLAEAVSLAATPQLRNMATLGGNVLQRPRCWYFRSHLFHCWLKGGDECQARDGENQQHAVFDMSPCVAVHPSDPPTALVALDAEVTLRGPRGERTVAARDFFAPPTDARRTETTLHPDELVLSVFIPHLAPGTRSVYFKAMDRKIWAFALVSVAAALRVEGGRIAEARLALGGVANVPIRATDAERSLVGAAPGAAAFARAADLALQGAQPLARNGYKVSLARGLITQALEAVAG